MSPRTHRRPAARLTAALVLFATTGLAGCATIENTFGLGSAPGYDPSISTASIPGAPQVRSGIAAWDGNISAPGMTAAHPTLMRQSWARVTNAHTGQTAVVQVTRRLENGRDRDIELSRDAAVAVGALHEGFATVLIEPIDPRQANIAEKQAMAPIPSPRQPAVVETAPFQPSLSRGYDPNLATATTPSRGVAYDPLPPLRAQRVAAPARPATAQIAAAPRPIAQPPAPQRAAVQQAAAPRTQAAAPARARYLQVGAYREPVNAQKMVHKIKGQGLASGAFGDVFIQTAYVDGSLFHRVRIGPIESDQLAARALAAAKSQGHATAKILRP